jgi:hypothetical protein
MEDNGPEYFAETRLNTSLGEMQRFIEFGIMGAAKTLVKRGSTRVLALNHKVESGM